MLPHISKHFQGFLLNILYVRVCSIAQLCPTFWTPWTVARQAPLSVGFSRQEYCGVGSHFLIQIIFPTQGSNPCLLHLLSWQADSLPLHHLGNLVRIYVYQFSSVAQSCPTLCDPMDCSTPGLPVHHQLQEFTQTHVHRISDDIQPSHPLSPPSSAPNPSQHQGLFQ